ncbi:MAG TPA: sirohydrochlorin cobaltochelatase [Lachnospiraceae bacterium]|nr:sirohydrochlorin cobaltochelatase [Lachnospiraceae bacterium]
MGTDARRKAILVVSFGTSYPDTRRKTIDSIEEEIGKEFSDYTIFRAFTSGVVIHRIKEHENLHVDTVTEALQRIRDEGIRELVVQPTHVINGIENDTMLAKIESYRHEFDKVSIGNPLLSDAKDYRMLAECMVQDNHINEGEAVLLMGHGSKHHANLAYPALEYTFIETGYNNIYLATYEGAPTFEEVLEQIKRRNYRRIHLVPLMIVAGKHIKNDMAGEGPNSWRAILEREGYQVECKRKGLGEIEGVRRMFVEHIREALEA